MMCQQHGALQHVPAVVVAGGVMGVVIWALKMM
jgi:hypothetical protein